MEHPFKRGLHVFDFDPYFINFTISASILTGSRGANAEHGSLWRLRIHGWCDGNSIAGYLVQRVKRCCLANTRHQFVLTAKIRRVRRAAFKQRDDG